ncbi:hypothetical protein BV25DRAFT_1949150 [Artomyces pyxidatus]|uniref:Uncharacterized protein n=1 Tax=Artomyces pyxidatus TaxID=48021 RepID=A0ACB8SZG2_9AGAM|nr:hypothetical protein BV25DRAFT_1949150 [Artomyces pyxidatus]
MFCHLRYSRLTSVHIATAEGSEVDRLSIRGTAVLTIGRTVGPTGLRGNLVSSYHMSLRSDIRGHIMHGRPPCKRLKWMILASKAVQTPWWCFGVWLCPCSVTEKASETVYLLCEESSNTTESMNNRVNTWICRE